MGRGFRAVDAANQGVEIIHRGKFKSCTDQQRRWLKRRQAVESVIGHLKRDNAMDRRWLLRAIVHLGLQGLVEPLFALLCTLATAFATAKAARKTAWGSIGLGDAVNFAGPTT